MSANHQKYHEFATLLHKLHNFTSSCETYTPQLQDHLASLQQFFRQEIVPFVNEESRELSYQTEMGKQLRLLEVDMMYLQGAKQASTARTRLDAILQRLDTLIQYCDAVLEEVGERG
jgi:hypothetical protein